MKNIYYIATLLFLFAFALATQPVAAQDEYGYSSENLLNSVQEAIRSQPGIDASKIDVWLQNRVVYLSGTVESQREMELAADAAYSVRGIRDVDTRGLQVAGYQRGARDTGFAGYGGEDRDLQNRVERALRRSRVDISGIDVEVRNRRVHLFGTVPSREAKNTAVAVANSVEGVEDVTSNDLMAGSDYRHPTRQQERGYYSPQEDQLRNRVYSALERTPNIDASKIDVRVSGDVVYLSGTFSTEEEKNIAHSVAHAVEGVENVFIKEFGAQ